MSQVAFPYPELIARPYRGKKPEKLLLYQCRLESAARLNAFIRQEFAETGKRCFGLLEMMEGAGISKADLADILSYNGKGPNGLTLI